MKLKNKTIAVYDIETPWITKEGIQKISKIYCIGVVTLLDSKVISEKVYTEYWTPYSNGSLLEGIRHLNSADIRVAFNNIGFDDYVISNILGTAFKPISPRWDFGALDLLICSKICYSKDELFAIDATLGIDKDLWGSFSLRAFGARLGNDKMHFDEFDTGLTADMAKYCIQDCLVTADLFLHLTAKENFPLNAVVDIEHKAASIITMQSVYGFYIDIEKTRRLNTKLLTEKLELATELSAIFSPKFLRDGKVKSYKKLSKVKKYLPNTEYIPLIGTKENK